MMGESTSLPIFISPAGMAGLAHPLAEKGLAEAAGVYGIIQMVRVISCPSSLSRSPSIHAAPTL